MGGEARQLSVGRELRSRSAASSALLWVGGGSGRLSAVDRPSGEWAFRRDVAQPGSAPEWGSGGRGFKSRRPDSPPALTAGGFVVPAGFFPSSLRLRLATLGSNPPDSPPALTAGGFVVPAGFFPSSLRLRLATLGSNPPDSPPALTAGGFVV